MVSSHSTVWWKWFMQDMHCNASMPKHENIRNNAFVKKSCVDFKKFIEKTVDHRDAGYHKEATYAAKNFVKSMKTGQNVCASLEADALKIAKCTKL